jgi:hypothetical protein
MPLTYAAEALRTALAGGKLAAGGLDLAVLALFALVLFGLTTRTLARRLD